MHQLNQLHYEALVTDNLKDLYEFHWNSTNKNGSSIGGVTPVHCAAINPNG